MFIKGKSRDEGKRKGSRSLQLRGMEIYIVHMGERSVMSGTECRISCRGNITPSEGGIKEGEDSENKFGFGRCFWGVEDFWWGGGGLWSWSV